MAARPAPATLREHPPGGPTVTRILLGSELRRLREAAGVARDAAGYAIRCSPSKISRLESGRVGVKQRDVADLLTLYGVRDEERRGRLLAMSRQTTTPAWWHEYGEALPQWEEAYVGLEEVATRIRTYETQAVPALLQTEDYAREILRLSHPDASGGEIDDRTAVRVRRSRVLTRDEPCTLWAVVEEAALRRPFGGPRVLRAQVEHLLEMTGRGNVTLYVVPERRAGYVPPGGPFTILRFAEPDLPDIVYIEQLGGARYLDKPDDLERHALALTRLSALAEPRAGTTSRLREILGQLP